MRRMDEAKKRGRPPKPEDEKLVRGVVFLTREQWDKLTRLGGVKWLRDKINRAKEPK